MQRTPEYEMAAKIYEQMYGEPPSEPPPPKQWEIIPHEQAKVAPFFPLYTVNKEEKIVDIYLHEGQMQGWNSPKRFVFMIAGKQSGKTIFGPLWLFREILKLGKGDYLAVSATADLFILKMLPALKQFFVNDLGIAKYWAGDRVLELCDLDTGKFGAITASDHEKMHTRIILRTAESEAGMQSASGKAAWLDEPGLYKSSVYKDIRGRLSLAAGPILGTTTPYEMNWLKTDIYDKWEKAKSDENGHPEIDVINFESTTNPLFSRAEFLSLQEDMQTYQFAMDYKGLFGRPPAAIYEKFVDRLRDEDGGHKARRFLIPREWPRMVAVDPGIVNPGKIWIAHDPQKDIYYAYRTEKATRREDAPELIRDDLERRDAIVHAKDDIKLAADQGERVIWWAVGNKGEKYWRDDYKSAGALGLREPDTVDVWEGIDRVTQLIGQYRLYIFDDLHELIAEIMSYSRVIKNGEPINEIREKSKFHLMDALRYFAVQVVKKRLDWHVQDKVGRYA